MTGRYPSRIITVNDGRFDIPPGHTSLAEMLKNQGFATTAVSASRVVRVTGTRVKRGYWRTPSSYSPRITARGSSSTTIRDTAAPCSTRPRLSRWCSGCPATRGGGGPAGRCADREGAPRTPTGDRDHQDTEAAAQNARQAAGTRLHRMSPRRLTPERRLQSADDDDRHRRRPGATPEHAAETDARHTLP